MTRTACLLVPDLPLRAQLRADPELAGRPLVVTSGPDSRAQVVAVSRAAAAAGIRPGASVAQARAACAALAVRVSSPALERAAREALLDAALSCSPRAAPAPHASGAFAAEAAVFLDASGTATLFRSEEGFAAALAARAEGLGLGGVVAVASARDLARVAARRIRGDPGHTLVLPPGSERAFLSPLPLDLLDPEDRLAQALTRLGIATVGDLLRLPRRALAERLGPEVLALLARARGEEVEAPLPAHTERRVEEGAELEHPVDRLEPLGFVLRGMLSRLVERLELRGLAAGALDLELGLEGGGRDTRRIGVAAPTGDVTVLLRLALLALEARSPQAPVESAWLATEGRPPSSDQLDLFRPRGPDPAKLDRTLAELELLCGPERVGTPSVANDHRPDAFALRPFSRSAVAGSDAAPAATAPALALRALRPPVAAEVRMARGAPVSVRSAVASGEVVNAAGPWRTTGRWWSETERFALDHYDVQVSDGSVLRLRFDWVQRRWEIDAIYD